MPTKRKITRIGFDLDRVFVNYPPFIPSGFIDWCYRRHDTKELSYNIPSNWLERQTRLATHIIPYLRPPIMKNINLVKKLSAEHKSYRFFLISSRFSFLEELTLKLLREYGLDRLFSGVELNIKDEQPHLFKEKVLKKLKIELYLDDDLDLLKHLKKHCQGVLLLWYNPGGAIRNSEPIPALSELTQIEEYLQ